MKVSRVATWWTHLSVLRPSILSLAGVSQWEEAAYCGCCLTLGFDRRSDLGFSWRTGLGHTCL